MLSRRELLRSSLTLMGLVLLGGCRRGEDLGSPMLSFHHGEAHCGVGLDDARVQAEAKGIRFSGQMTTPDPCHRLEAVLEVKNSELIVHISAVSEKAPDRVCIQCLGQVPYTGEIVNVRPGQYTVKIYHDKREIKSAPVTIL
ncbi:MAG: hypothetical protein RMJ29_06875 [Candidatus Bipolaricaulota bacterium]|nr:hypothetical protein [Candidatus Bipolaricaulota bacterium]